MLRQVFFLILLLLFLQFFSMFMIFFRFFFFVFGLDVGGCICRLNYSLEVKPASKCGTLH